MESLSNRVLIVVFDALRPECVTPELMPTLCSLASKGARYTNMRSVFLSETRVAQSTLATGCWPRGHGIMANKLMAPALCPDAVLNTQDDVALEAAALRTGGRLLARATLSERLARVGRSYASLSAGTPGGGRLIHHDAATTGRFRLAMRRPEATVPEGALAAITQAVGPMPAFSLPARAWTRWAVDAYLGYVEPVHAPDVMLLWLNEPDETFHFRGIGSEDARVAIAHADQMLARLIAHHRAALDEGALSIIALSDHGQITLRGAPLDLVARLQDAGFAAAGQPGPGIDVVVVGDNAGGFWLRTPDEAKRTQLERALIAWWQGQAFAGPLFTRSTHAGTFTLADVFIDHPHAPDIAFVCAGDESANAHGFYGMTTHDAGYPIGGGCHGGLSRQEMSNVLVLAGKAFACAHIDTPAGLVDIAPTVMALLGHDIEAGTEANIGAGVDGRVLREAFASASASASAYVGAGAPAPPAWNRTVTQAVTPDGARTYHLSHFNLADGARYIDHAWST
ncbi:MAG: alkaline phosphatase family protein [Pseudomonadota bacterium]